MKRRFLAGLHLPLFLAACLVPASLAKALGFRRSHPRSQAPLLSAKPLRPVPSRFATKSTVPPAPPPRWGANTSGPFFTGTAEVDPPGSFYVEPYIFDNRGTGGSSRQFTQKLSIGMGHNLEFDALMPLVLNSTNATSTPLQTSASSFGPGDAEIYFKYQLTSDADTYRLLARPALTVSTNFILPLGNTANLNPQKNGTDQFGNGTYQEGIGLVVRKRFKPYALYGQVENYFIDPATVTNGYTFDNQLASVTSSGPVKMIDGNLFTYSGTIEDVFNTRHGFGGLLELTGEAQSSSNLFFGTATAPSFSYVSMAPELEFTWPAGGHFAATWGGGVLMPVHRVNYPRTVTPMMTVSFYFNGPHGSRSSH